MELRHLPLAFVLCLAAVGLPAGAQPPPDFDIRGPRAETLPLAAVRPAPEQGRALEELRREARGPVTVRWSAFTGAPSRIHAGRRAVTPPSHAPAHAVANAFLGRYRRLFGLSPRDVQAIRVSRELGTAHNGVTHLTLQQQVDGIDVFRGALEIHIDRDGRILSVSGEAIPNVESAIQAASPTLGADEATFVAAAAVGVAAPSTPSSGELVYFPLEVGDLRLAWRVGFEDTGDGSLYESIVDAVDGTVLWWQTRTHHDHFPAQGQVYASDDPNPNTPKGTAAGIVVRTDAPFNGTGFFPHDDLHYDWWAGGARTTTTSNNVDAYADRDGDNSPDPGSRPTTGPDERFDFPLDLTMDPSTYTDAAVTNLFYWNNRLHDFFYVLGFDEAAGNFQTDNFGLGGAGGDPVRAEAQDNRDGAEPSLCNANMGTPADGSSPRMQMFQCTSAAPERDGDLDNVVIGHEYTHGVHSRLVPTSGNQRGNEGWSDYFGLSLVAEDGDPYAGAYGVGNWLFAGNGDGIRSDPYSTDATLYKRTYADINDASTSCQVRTCSEDDTKTCTEDADCAGTCVALTGCKFHEDCQPPNTAIDQSPCRSQVHRTGELWANALWIARMNLVYKWGFAPGADTMNRLVIDGMKLSPADPTFLDGRDAILTADLANNGGVNQCLIWDGFARMGMGFSAVTTGVLDLNPIEAFDVPAGCAPVLQVSGPTDLGGVCTGDSGSETLSVYNTGGGELIVSSVEVASGSSDVSVDPTPKTPVFIGAGAHVDFTVRCSPSSPGPKSATIRIESNAAGSPFDVQYTCLGGEPDINVALADSGDFGAVCKGTLGDLALTLFNQGTCNLEISDLALLPDAGPFLLPEDLQLPLVLSPDADFTAPIRFAPAECFDTAATRTLRIASDDPDEATLDVDLSGVAPCPDLVIDTDPVTGLVAFPTTVADATGSLGCSSERGVVLRNASVCPLTIQSITAQGVSGDPADFAVAAPSAFPILLPGGEETLTATVRFAPRGDADPLAPSEVSGLLSVVSDDPDVPHQASLCGESAAQSGVRILVTDVSTGLPVPVASVDEIRVSSKGIHDPGPINLRWTDQVVSTETVCGAEVLYHVDQETLPSTETSGANPSSSYQAKAKEGNLQTTQSFGLGQCELREFQLEIRDSGASACLLLPKGSSCTTDGECCSGRCTGPAGGKTCK